MGLGERKNPSRVSASDTALLSVEPLNDAKTTLADFLSILLEDSSQPIDAENGLSKEQLEGL